MINTAGAHPNVNEAIHRRARELADHPPQLTPEQMVLLNAVFSHRKDGGR